MDSQVQGLKLGAVADNKSLSLTSRWTLTGWSNRQAETSWSSTRSAKSCMWGGLTPHSSQCLAGKQSSASGTWAKKVQWRLQRTLTESWGALGGLLPPDWVKWLCPSQCWWDSISKTLSYSGLPNERNETTGESNEQPVRGLRAWIIKSAKML